MWASVVRWGGGSVGLPWALAISGLVPALGLKAVGRGPGTARAPSAASLAQFTSVCIGPTGEGEHRAPLPSQNDRAPGASLCSDGNGHTAATQCHAVFVFAESLASAPLRSGADSPSAGHVRGA
jgi:hypothetical protein